ncbi:MAG TPA: cytosine permease [Galbitalea sp.]|nr:cytosine permease [Galbitalea sp.]
MADDDGDVRGEPGPDDLLGPPGPRRSNFTPPPTDAESLEAANNLFNDDAIAAALAAELARVASGPIPIQKPAQPAAAVPPPVVLAPPQTPATPPSSFAPQSASSSFSPPPVSSEPATPVASPPAAVVPSESASQIPPAPAPATPAAPEAAPAADPEPAVRPVSPPAAPSGPPDWASSLFGQPTPTVRDETAAPIQDPFAPSAPPFAPSNGPFPPPSEADASAAPVSTTDAEALRALYRGAPAPTVPPADAPPPPGYESAGFEPTGYESTVSSPGDSGFGSADTRSRRQSLADDASAPAQPEAASPSTLDAIEQLQAQLHLQEQEAREFAAWETSMQAIGTPEALAEVERARAELSGQTPPVVQEPPASAPVPELAPTSAPSAEAASVPTTEPTSQPEPTPTPEEPAVPAYDDVSPTLAPPTDGPVSGLTPPAESLYPPPPSTEQPFVTLSPPTDEIPADADSDTWDVQLPPLADESQFPGFAPPTAEVPADIYAAPADPRDLSFDLTPAAPDAPVFLEPPALVEPAEPNSGDGVADLYRAAGDVPPPATEDADTAPPVFDVLPPGVDVPSPVFDSPPPSPPRVDSPPPASAPSLIPGGFDDLLSGSPDGAPPLPGPVWSAPDPVPVEQSPDEEPGGRRPFGEGVERDDAVDPSDSIFGSVPGPVSVNTAGVAVVPQRVMLESQPISVLTLDDPAASTSPRELVAPKVVPAESVGLEPTPLEQRVGRSARLFWLWFAANSSIVAIVFGTVIFALGVSLRQAIVATLAGVALSFIPLGLGTLAGKRSGQPTMVISRATFGVVGNTLPALIALFSRLFWAAGLLWILGAGTADILVGAKLADGFTGDQLTLIVIALGFVVAVVLAYFGYALISIAQLIISIISGLAIVGFIALTAQYLNVGTALTTGDGPWILVVTGAVLVFSFVGLAWANSSADVARYQRVGSSGGAGMLWATFGAAVPSFVLICYGALLAASNPTLAQNIATNPLDSLGRLLPVWYPAPLLAATGLSLISGVVLSMYSGGFALQATGLRLRRSLSTLLVGVLVVIFALALAFSVTDFMQLLRDLATTIAVPVAAWAGLFGSEIMIRKRRFDSPSLLKRGGVYADARWGNLLALVLITVVGFGFLSATLPGLDWEGYLFGVLGISLKSAVATSDFGVLVALGLGILFPLVAGIPGIRGQERAERPPE